MTDEEGVQCDARRFRASGRADVTPAVLQWKKGFLFSVITKM